MEYVCNDIKITEEKNENRQEILTAYAKAVVKEKGQSKETESHE